MRRIPERPEHLTDEWLSSTLRAVGMLGDVRLVAHRTEISETHGAAAVIVRIELAYDREAEALPRTLVAKIASPYEPIRRLMHAVGGYAREVEFYRHFGADPGISTPRCYHADIDLKSGAFVLLLEDMGAARVVDWFVTSTEDVELAVRHLAPFHARWWNDDRLRGLPFLHYPGGPEDAAFMAQAKFALAAALPAARARYRAELPASLVAVADHLQNHFDALMEIRREAWRDSTTLVHGDFHPGQIFYPSGKGGRFAVFDWQPGRAGGGGGDLARIIATGLTPDQQRACDERLIKLYHSLLVEHGVSGYDIERCREDYVRGLITSVAINIIASVNIDPALIEEFDAASEVRTTDAMFGWLAAAIEAHHVLDALPV